MASSCTTKTLALAFRWSSATNSPATIAPGTRRCAPSGTCIGASPTASAGFRRRASPTIQSATHRTCWSTTSARCMGHLGLEQAHPRRLFDGRQHGPELRAALPRAVPRRSSSSAPAPARPIASASSRTSSTPSASCALRASRRSPRRTRKAPRVSRSNAKTRTAVRSFASSWLSTRRSDRRSR